MTIDKTLTSIEQHRSGKIAPFASPSEENNSVSQSATATSSQVKYDQYKVPERYTPHPNQSNGAVKGVNGQSGHRSGGNLTVAAEHEMPYAPTAPYSYLGPSSSYSSTQNAYAPTAFVGTEAATSASQQATAAAATAYLYSRPSSTTPVYQAAMPASLVAGPQMSWRTWAGSMAGNMPANTSPEEYLNSASALMQLGNAPGTATSAPATTNLQVEHSLDAAQPWPLMIFDGSTGV